MSIILDIAIRLRSLWATLIALLLGALLIGLAGHDPLTAYAVLFREGFADYWGFANTLVKASPIVLAALAVCLPYRAGLYNIGGEGQIYIGGLCATLMGLGLPDCPPWLGITLVMASAMIGGAAWAAIAGALKAYRGVNEVIVTLLLNFVAIHIVSYAVSGPLLAEGAPYPFSEQLPAKLHLPMLLPQTDAHLGALFGLVLAACLHVHFTRTSHGLALDVIGRNPQAARYAGIAVERQIVVAMALGGGLAGLAGGLEIVGLKYRLFHLFSAGYGFDGIVVAFMAGAQPLLVPLAGLLIAALKAGSGSMQRAIGLDGSIVEAILGLVVMTVAAGLAWKPSPASLLAFLRSKPATGEPVDLSPQKAAP